MQKKWSLPSFYTLKSRLQDLQFLPGPHSEILQYLPGEVVYPEVPGSELCWLSWDEASIDKGVVYDNALKQCLGLVTPEPARNEEERNSLAKKVIVFGLKGSLGGNGNKSSTDFLARTSTKLCCGSACRC